jgi:hypothetical protein
MKKTLQTANGIALIITVVISYLSNTGVFNGNTMKTISDKYHNYFTPAGYAFSIWGVIYLGLFGFVFYTGRSLFKKSDSNTSENNVVIKIGWWFVLSCIANSLWVVFWLYDFIGISVILMVLLLFSLLKIIINTRMELDFHPLKKYIFIFWPFAIYSGWITVALIADIAAWLTKINWNGWGISSISWTIIMIVLAAVINLLMIFKRNLREYALVSIWALIAIAVSNQNDVPRILYVCYTAAAIILAGIVIHSLKNRKGRSVDAM